MGIKFTNSWGQVTDNTAQLAEIANQVALKADEADLQSAILGIMPDGIIDGGMTSFFKPGKNLFNKAAATSGYYVSHTTGELVAGTGWYASEFIEIVPETAYVRVQNQIVAYYDADKAFISGVQQATAFTTPATAKYVRLSVYNTYYNTEQLELGSTSTAYEPFFYFMQTGYKVRAENYTEVIVAASGGDFTTINAALASITDAAEDNQYLVYVKNGTYNEMINVKAYVNMKGENKYKTIIDFTGVYANRNDLSAVYGEKTATMENFTIETFDSKYPLHSDNNTGDYKFIIKNCIMRHKGFTGGEAAKPVGIGLNQNQHIEILDCEMYGNGVAGAEGVFFHNADTGDGYRSLRVENCKIRGVSYGFKPNGIAALFNQKNDAFLINNDIQADIAEFYIMASTDLSWNIISRGNTLNHVYRPGNNYIVEQPGFTRRVKNAGANLTKGMIVALVIHLM
jgi:hypothetical protein